MLLVAPRSTSPLRSCRPRTGQSRWPSSFRAKGFALVAAWSAYALVHWKQSTVSINFHSMGDNLIVLDTWRQFVTVSLDSFEKSPLAMLGGGYGR